jgi:HPt (histidine-containing phosphotransfer) domain-containing protein
MAKINLDYLNELGGGDVEFTIEMLQTYLEETTKDVQELQEALTNENSERIAFIAHRTKAAFRMLGLNEITEMAQNIELTAKKGNIPAKALRIPVNSLIDEAKNSFEEAQQLIKNLKHQ